MARRGSKGGPPHSAHRPWSAQEDEQLRDLIAAHGAQKWASLARMMPGRNGKQVRERWTNHLDPSLKHGEWTAREDMWIVGMRYAAGSKWSLFASFMEGRTAASIKNHWNATLDRCVSQGEFDEEECLRSVPTHIMDAIRSDTPGVPPPLPPHHSHAADTMSVSSCSPPRKGHGPAGQRRSRRSSSTRRQSVSTRARSYTDMRFDEHHGEEGEEEQLPPSSACVAGQEQQQEEDEGGAGMVTRPAAPTLEVSCCCQDDERTDMSLFSPAFKRCRYDDGSGHFQQQQQHQQQPHSHHYGMLLDLQSPTNTTMLLTAQPSPCGTGSLLREEPSPSSCLLGPFFGGNSAPTVPTPTPSPAPMPIKQEFKNKRKLAGSGSSPLERLGRGLRLDSKSNSPSTMCPPSSSSSSSSSSSGSVKSSSAPLVVLPQSLPGNDVEAIQRYWRMGRPRKSSPPSSSPMQQERLRLDLAGKGVLNLSVWSDKAHNNSNSKCKDKGNATPVSQPGAAGGWFLPSPYPSTAVGYDVGVLTPSNIMHHHQQQHCFLSGSPSLVGGCESPGFSFFL